MLDNAKQASVLLTLPWLAVGVVIGVVFDWVGAILFLVMIALFAVGFYGTLRGEQSVYGEWKSSRDSR